MLDEIKLPANPYSRSKEHCEKTHARLMKLVESVDEKIASEAIKMAFSLDKQLFHIAADPRIAELMESRSGDKKESVDLGGSPERKLSGLKIVG